MNTRTQFSVHDTDPELYAALARLFTPQQGGTSEWIEIKADGVDLTFFKQTEKPETAPTEFVHFSSKVAEQFEEKLLANVLGDDAPVGIDLDGPVA